MGADSAPVFRRCRGERAITASIADGVSIPDELQVATAKNGEQVEPDLPPIANIPDLRSPIITKLNGKDSELIIYLLTYQPIAKEIVKDPAHRELARRLKARFPWLDIGVNAL